MLSSLIITLLWIFPEAQPRTLAVDIERSAITFSATHMGFLTVDGTFSMFEASLTLQNKQPERVIGNIQVNSIDTKEPMRDQTLLEVGYLHAEQFPRIHFESLEIHSNGDGYTVEGSLNIKGQIRSVTIPCQFNSLEEGSLRITGEINLSRNAFDLEFGAMNALIGDNIHIQIDLVFD